MMKNRRAVIGLAALVAIGILGWGGWAWYRSSMEVATDDAYVDGTISPVSAKVTGHIVELRVNDNQAVRTGEILLRVDPRDYEAKRDLDRMQQLMKNDYVSRREHDDAVAALEGAEAALEAARRRLAAIEKEVQQTEAEVASRVLGTEQARQRVAEVSGTLSRAESQQQTVSVKAAELARAEALLKSAQADLAVAELNLEHTLVRAPLDGVVSKRSVEVGQIVQNGQPLLALVPLHDVWVVANFKETQLTKIRPGQKAEVRVDTFPGVVFHGSVNSISAGTGSRFSLLPPENATGNWVKVVQRVPVKILLDSNSGGDPQPLRAGMSAYVTVKTR